MFENSSLNQCAQITLSFSKETDLIQIIIRRMTPVPTKNFSKHSAGANSIRLRLTAENSPSVRWTASASARFSPETAKMHDTCWNYVAACTKMWSACKRTCPRPGWPNDKVKKGVLYVEKIVILCLSLPECRQFRESYIYGDTKEFEWVQNHDGKPFDLSDYSQTRYFRFYKIILIIELITIISNKNETWNFLL